MRTAWEPQVGLPVTVSIQAVGDASWDASIVFITLRSGGRTAGGQAVSCPIRRWQHQVGQPHSWGVGNKCGAHAAAARFGAKQKAVATESGSGSSVLSRAAGFQFLLSSGR
jgi:hypothetical protein